MGKNGAGKTTLLTHMASGHIEGLPLHVKTTYVQHDDSSDDNGMSLIEELLVSREMMAVGVTREEAVTALKQINFTDGMLQNPRNSLSGGWKMKLLIIRAMLSKANVLLLDEPTNHLDQDSVDALTLELENYPGAVVIVTHSESMLRQVAKKLIVFHQNKVDCLNLGYEEFLSKVGWEDEIESGVPDKIKDRPSRQEIKRLRAELIVERGRELNPLKKKIETLEKRIITHEQEQQKLETDMISWSTQGESKKIQDASQRLGVVKKIIDEDFELLSQISSEHDEIFNRYELKLSELIE
jgi:ATP-binding cassette subfamily F protein 3